jgi:cytochrome c553
MLIGCSVLDTIATLFDSAPQQSTIKGDPIRGQELFQVGVNNAPPCSTCHLVEVGGTGFSLAPNLQAIASTARNRDATISPEQYIKNSIINPGDFVVSGFRVSMYTDYATHLSEQDIADLIAYLLTL